uniref:Uncharacterized protein n=1 Tax=Grammatophora oceanica TaxID=210454 RepID=A0A7S1YG99_9STRA
MLIMCCSVGLAKLKGKYWRTTHKYGVRIPHSVDEALRIDEETGTDFWRKAINKEMSKAKVAWNPDDDLRLKPAACSGLTFLLGVLTSNRVIGSGDRGISRVFTLFIPSALKYCPTHRGKLLAGARHRSCASRRPLLLGCASCSAKVFGECIGGGKPTHSLQA